MENREELISLRRFEKNDVLEIFDAAIQNKISLYVQSTNSPNMLLLSTPQIQKIRTSHPEKAQVYIKTDISTVFYHFMDKQSSEAIKQYQTISFLDLWVIKSESDALLQKTLSEHSPMSNAEKSTLLKMILGMAMAAYKFNPKERRNEATGSKKGSIKADLEKMGFDITEDTVRKYLNEAVKKYLPNVVYED